MPEPTAEPIPPEPGQAAPSAPPAGSDPVPAAVPEEPAPAAQTPATPGTEEPPATPEPAPAPPDVGTGEPTGTSQNGPTPSETSGTAEPGTEGPDAEAELPEAPATPPEPEAPPVAAKIYRVWLSEVDSDADAAAEWQRLLAAYPDLLGQRVPLLRRVDLGEAGVRYRVLAGTFDDRAGATSLCTAIRERDEEAYCMVVLN